MKPGNNKFTLVFIITFFLSLFIFSSQIFAVNPIISEMLPFSVRDGDPMQVNEWIEIYNPDCIDMSQWTVEENNEENNGKYALNLNFIGVSVYGVYNFSSDKLNNNGDFILLRNAVGNEIDKWEYDTAQKGQSMIDTPDGWTLTESITKGTPNSSTSPEDTTCPTPDSTPSPTPTASPSPFPYLNYDNISIVELYPSPNIDEQEWVELRNNNDFGVDLTGWKLIDLNNNVKTITDFSIAGNSLAYFNLGQGFLNNDGDTLKLVYGETVKDELPHPYPKIDKGYSWSLVSGQWCLTKPSSGNSNSACHTATATDNSQTSTPNPTTTITAMPSTNLSSSSTAKPKRKLPKLLESTSHDKPATVAGAATSTPVKKNYSLLMPLFITAIGILFLLPVLTPYLKPKLANIISNWFAKNDTISKS